MHSFSCKQPICFLTSALDIQGHSDIKINIIIFVKSKPILTQLWNLHMALKVQILQFSENSIPFKISMYLCLLTDHERLCNSHVQVFLTPDFVFMEVCMLAIIHYTRHKVYYFI